METRANYVAVGFFTLVVILASFVFIYWVANFDDEANLVPINVKIEGAVTGLSAGSEVHFNGIKVGKVERVVFDADDPRVVYALSEINADTPVRADTRATIGSQGLTGIAYISLKGGTPTAQSLFETSKNGEPPLIEAKPSAVADILETVRDVASKANNALGTFEEFINENRKPLSRTVANVETFSKALSDNAEGVDEFLASAAGVGESLASLGEKLDGTIKGLEGLVAAVEPEKVRTTLANIEAFTGDLRRNGAKIDEVIASVEQVAGELQTFSANLNTSLAKADNILGAVDAAEVRQTIADIRKTAAGAEQIVADARGVSETLSKRRADIDATITNAQEMVARLNQSSKRVDGVLAKLDGFLGSGDSDDIMDEVRLTLAEFRNVATSLQARVNEISGGISRFSNSGLQDVKALVSDTRRSISRFDRVIGDLERDPQGFLFGNSGVKTYSGRPRR